MSAAICAAGLILWAAFLQFIFAPTDSGDDTPDDRTRRRLAQERAAERDLYPNRSPRTLPDSRLTDTDLERWPVLKREPR